MSNAQFECKMKKNTYTWHIFVSFITEPEGPLYSYTNPKSRFVLNSKTHYLAFFTNFCTTIPKELFKKLVRLFYCFQIKLKT